MKVGDTVYKKRSAWGMSAMHKTTIEGETPKYWRVDGELFHKGSLSKRGETIYGGWKITPVTDELTREYEQFCEGVERKP